MLQPRQYLKQIGEQILIIAHETFGPPGSANATINQEDNNETNVRSILHSLLKAVAPLGAVAQLGCENQSAAQEAGRR
ncbi:hypothetical protein CALCODRAFT_494509 [Calocera cornea HHB12733]|uniref:Uncharacterized protein n=1 Tax=Calocera cornea HHB12733 TaxID=1353952 RepID=A0A165H322_9BASI|nr:hypothetical protein CALCODRAFT_494509 [Calocera cornea HHB12733]